ncbi:MAG: hypothetical protein F7C07_05185 [Desulfurococcales archaeon]|nr:hypothetical protein [Desulfurococcales archaeon]
MADAKIVVYSGLDGTSRLAVRVVREAAVLLARNYGVEVDVEVTEIPVGDTEAAQHGLPIIKVNDEVLAQASVPSLSLIVDRVFEYLASNIELGPLKFPVFCCTERTLRQTA